jgi:DNA-binding NtrC family response regulator
MVRIALYSEDLGLQRRISSTLGKEFEVLLEPTKAGICQLHEESKCDAFILHLSPGAGPLQERIDCSRRLIAARAFVIIVADDGVETTAVELVRIGAKGYFRTAGSILDLKTTLAGVHDNFPLAPRRRSAAPPLETDTCDGMIGASPLMQDIYRLVHLVADLNVSVFVTGESGTGKELIARAIHNLGSRPNQPFVAVSCGAIPETLIEAELFGHEKGAFTGTVGTRQGYLEEAGCGTLFLDEIGDLSLQAQVKLLRVLQQREFSRLGSNRLIPLKARVIFATHRNLDEMVSQGTFRQDLYYRINVVRINAPALREHPEDIPRIASHFLQFYSRMYNLPSTTIDPQAIAMMQNYAWPGNVRELEHFIQSTIILCQGDNIYPDDLPLKIRGAENENVVDIGHYLPEDSFEKHLTNYKIKLALAAVRQNDGNKTLAARSLHISRAYLHRLLRLGEEEPGADLQFPEVEAM